jgi:hypothetical protein
MPITKKSLTQILSLLVIGAVLKRKRNEERRMDEMNMPIATEYRSGSRISGTRNLKWISTKVFVNISQFGRIHERVRGYTH